MLSVASDGGLRNFVRVVIACGPLFFGLLALALFDGLYKNLSGEAGSFGVFSLVLPGVLIAVLGLRRRPGLMFETKHLLIAYALSIGSALLVYPSPVIVSLVESDVASSGQIHSGSMLFSVILGLIFGMSLRASVGALRSDTQQ